MICPCPPKTIGLATRLAASATLFVKRISLHAYSRTTAIAQLRKTNKTHVAYLSSWHKSIFGNKLRTIEAKNP